MIVPELSAYPKSDVTSAAASPIGGRSRRPIDHMVLLS